MIKALAATTDGRRMLLLGLSGENVARLMADEPIRFNAADVGLPGLVVAVVGGRTEQDIVTQLRAAGLPPAVEFDLDDWRLTHGSAAGIEAECPRCGEPVGAPQTAGEGWFSVGGVRAAALAHWTARHAGGAAPTRAAAQVSVPVAVCTCGSPSRPHPRGGGGCRR